MDEVAQYFGDESSDLINFFSDIDESDPIFSNDEGNTSNSTNNLDSDSQTEEEGYTRSVKRETEIQQFVIPEVQCLVDPHLQNVEAGSPLHGEQKKRKIQVPKFEGILPLFQPNLLSMMQGMLPNNQVFNDISLSLPSDQSTDLTLCSKMNQRQKKKLRMMKNRESANKSRIKKKNAMIGLQSEVDSLKNEVQKLNQELAAVKAENCSLKNHNSFLQNLLTKSSLPSAAVVESFKAEGTSESHSTNMAAGGVALFAFAFFCFTFNSFPSSGDTHADAHRQGRTLLSTDAFAQTSVLITHLPSSQHILSTGLIILSFFALKQCFNGVHAYVCGMLPLYSKKKTI